MWKYVSRTVRHAVEKGNGLFHCRSLNLQDGSLCPFSSRKSEVRICCEGSDSENNKNSKNSSEHTFSDTFRYYLSQNFFRAITCSSAMILGWYASHLICLRERSSINLEYCKRCDEKKYQEKRLLLDKCFFVPHTVWAQPIGIKHINNRRGHIERSEEEELPSRSGSTSDSAESSVKTSSLEDAAEQFAFVTGHVENQLGAACMQQSQAAASVGHFEAGTHYRNSAAAFNLGLCYEKGIGIKKDPERAAECYQIASEQGHTSAMYNLALYYAQGRGGLPIDFNRARLLFERAADLGHAESIAALRSDATATSIERNVQHMEYTPSSHKFAISLMNGI